MKRIRLKKKKFPNKRKKATSLIEVVVMLGIISVTIVFSMTIIIKSSLQIKSNEIEDNSNTQLVEALEALKSPQPVLTNDDPSSWETASGSTQYFNIKKSNNGLILQHNAGDTILNPSSCINTSKYYIQGLNFTACIQIQIKPKTNTNNYFESDVLLVYLTSNEVRTKDLKTYRYYPFCNPASNNCTN